MAPAEDKKLAATFGLLLLPIEMREQVGSKAWEDAPLEDELMLAGLVLVEVRLIPSFPFKVERFWRWDEDF
ncbi:hypothetical protein L195_g063087, partial [Trifolium pratense]